MDVQKIRTIGNIRVGVPDVSPTAPSHVRGISQARSERDARRSTGIRPKDHDVIDPRMPRLSPA